MARIRSVKPDCGDSKDMAKVSFAARYFFVLLWCFLDDEGRTEWTTKKLAGEMYAHDENVGGEQLEKWLAECLNAGLLVAYEIGEVRYVSAPTFLKHQRISKPTPSRFPAPPVSLKNGKKRPNSKKTPRPLREPSGSPPLPVAGKKPSEMELGNGNGKGNGKGVSEGKPKNLRKSPVHKKEILSPEKREPEFAEVLARQKAELAKARGEPPGKEPEPESDDDKRLREVQERIRAEKSAAGLVPVGDLVGEFGAEFGGAP